MGVFMSGFGALFTLCLVACLSLSCVPQVGATNGLRVGFYHRTCPSVEKIIFRSLHRSYKKDQKIAPGILRLVFHDCFVRGCDCSIMLDGPASEKMSFANVFTDQTYEAVDCAKREVEKACPGVVSCSDVLQFAARDSVVLSGGFGWAVPAGRRDGFVSKIEDVLLNLPSPFSNISTLIELFERKGLTADQLVALSGAHTIGTASCFAFDNRIHAPKPDPSLHPALARSLKKQCPTPALFSRVTMDSTPHRFDARYFRDVVGGRALMSSDQALMEDHRTRTSVYKYRSMSEFSRAFAKAMVAMSKIDVLTGQHGEIRRKMTVVN